jgi:hypothetical protein
VRSLSVILGAALLGAPPAVAAEPVNLLAPEPAAAAASPCQGAAAEQAALEAERAALNARIGDIALGRSRPRRKVSGGEVAAGVAGTAASVLLPFGVGALLGAGASAAAKSGRRKRAAPPPPDVPAMIERLHAIDARLAGLRACGSE